MKYAGLLAIILYKATHKVNMKNKYFKLARNVSELSDYPRHHIGCVVVYKGKVISTGYNCTKTHPLQKAYNKERFPEDCSPHSMHAETHALCSIRGMDIDWNKAVIYNYREHKDGSLGLARPCKSCMKLIRDMGIRKVCYTTNEGMAEEEIC